MKRNALTLIELLIAIGILSVTMLLIAAGFHAGTMMSIAVSDETTSGAVFQKAKAEIQSHVRSKDILFDPNPSTNNLIVLPDGAHDRKLDSKSLFSWSALVRPMGASGPMGNLCQVVIVASRRPSGEPDFMPNLAKVNCTGSDTSARTLDIDSGDISKVPNGGYIIDGTTGTAYVVISREGDKVVVLSEPPNITSSRTFWVVPAPSGSEQSPAIRVFQAMLYLP